jgi:parallel beta-helix repeat protein
MKNISNKKIATSLILTSFFTVTASITAHAEQIGFPSTSINVSQRNSADTEDCGTNRTQRCRTIQHAVNRIAPGGIIRVSRGTYHENILVDKADIVIVSRDGRFQTIIDGSGATNEDVSEAMRIIANGVRIGRRNSVWNGFTFRNSVASGLFNIGSNVNITGNAAVNNGARGFQFGLSTVDDFIDNSSKNITDDPLNGATFVNDVANLQTQSNITVNNNIANENALGGFYFSAFDDSSVRNNRARFNRTPGGVLGLGQGAGFWIDVGSNAVTLFRNRASNNAADGIFYRRGFGPQPGGLVTNQTAIRNRVSSNGRHGIIFMGNNIVAQGNTSESNQGDGFHFLGYDTVSDVSYNALRRNSGAGLGFAANFAGANASVSPLNFDAYGNHPVEFGGIHHNIITDNLSHEFPDELGDTFDRCGIATILNNGTVIEMSHNFWGSNQEICDLSGNTVQQNNPARWTNGLGPNGL